MKGGGGKGKEEGITEAVSEWSDKYFGPILLHFVDMAMFPADDVCSRWEVRQTEWP
jgi:hypothetical protein